MPTPSASRQELTQLFVDLSRGYQAAQRTREIIAQIGEAVEDVAAGAVFEMRAEEIQKAVAGTGESIPSEAGRR
jgi:hypothetical protein